MFDTIKGIIGDIAAGVIKDQRIALSQEQLTALDAKLREALSENENLSQRVTELEGLVAERDAKIAQLQPSADLDPLAFEILKFFFNQSRDLSTKEVATQFSLPVGVAEFHADTLRQRSLIANPPWHFHGVRNASCVIRHHVGRPQICHGTSINPSYG
jgi:hypothetical protein